jgi:hypothetical protein
MEDQRMKAVVTLVLAVAIFALPMGASARSYGYYTANYAPAPAAYGYGYAPAACPVAPPPAQCVQETNCFNPLGIVGDVFTGVGSAIAGIGSIFGTTFSTSCTPCY